MPAIYHLNPDIMRRTKDGEVLLRYAVWWRPEHILVSVYGLTGRSALTWRLLSRHEFHHHDEAVVDEAGRNFAAIWAHTHGIGDYHVIRGTTYPLQTTVPGTAYTKKENQP